MSAADGTVHGVAVSRSEPLRGVRRLTAQRLLQGATETAAVTAMAEVDATALLAALEQERQAAPGVTLTHLLVAALARTVRRHPRLNATLVDETIHDYATVNVALALALPNGELAVGVIRAADQKAVSTIADEARGLQARAEAGGLRLDDVRGGTITLSNYGALRHVVWATPILSPGQAAVLGVGRVRPWPMPGSDGDPWAVRPMLPLSLTYDHRIVDGMPVGRFLDDLADRLEADDWRAAPVEE